jgi:hypothetical protein
MAAADEHLLHKVQSLTDLSLAVLLCLVNREHCVVSTEPEAVDDLIHELQAISSRIFGLRSVVVSCGPQTTLDEFATALLLPECATPVIANRDLAGSPSRGTTQNGSYFPAHPPSSGHGVGSPGARSLTAMANVILARNLDQAPKVVQLQALELVRTRRIFTRTAVQAAPKQFLFVAVVGASSGGQAKVTQHLNDLLFLSHWHDPEEDGFEFLDEEEEGEDDLIDGNAKQGTATPPAKPKSTVSQHDAGDAVSFASTESIVKGHHSASTPKPDRPAITEDDISHLAQRTREVQVDIDVLRYQMNIIAFLRMHRAVASGVAPVATKHFETLAKSLAPLHGITYVTPTLVAMAARKIYTHRIAIVAPERERSMQWGSDLPAIRAVLEGVGPEDVIEDVLESVTAPV